MNLICFADRNWSEGFSETQQLLVRLANRGHRILYFDPRGESGLRDVGPRTLYVHTQKTDQVIRSLQFADSTLFITSPSALPDISSLQGRPAVYYGVAHPGDSCLKSVDIALTATPGLLPQFQQSQPRSYVLEPATDAVVASQSGDLARSWDQQAYQLEAHLEAARALAVERGLRSTARLRAIAGATADSVWPDRTERLEEYGRSLTASLTPLLRGMLSVTRAAGVIYYPVRYAARVLTGKRDPAIRKILIGRKAVMGDIIVLAPMLAALRKRYPEAKIVMAVQKGMPAGPLLESSKDIDEIRVLDFLDSTSRLHQLKGVLRLFAEGFDVAFSGSTYFLIREVFLSGAPKTFGIYNGLELQKENKEVLPADLTIHEAELNVQLVELLTGQPENRVRPPQLTLDPEKIRQRTAELLPKLPMPKGAKILTIHAGSKNPTRRWPTERFAELSTRLLTGDATLWLAFTGSPGERMLVEQIRTGIPAHLQNRVMDTTGITDLHSLSGLLAMSKAALSNDTGVMHLARTVGTPLVAVLGPENDRRWSPHPMGDAPAIAVRNVVPCAPCSRDACEALYCLRSMSVERVYAEIARLLGSEEVRQGPYRLERKMTHADWRMLSEEGFEPPKMSVVVVADADAAPGLVQDLARQSYPAFDTVVLKPDLSRGHTAFETILGEAQGDLFSLLTPDVPWEPARLSAHAAALTRVPDAAYAYTPPRLGSRDYGASPRLGAYTLRRSEIERALPEMRFNGSASSFMDLANGLIQRHTGVAADVPMPASPQ